MNRTRRGKKKRGGREDEATIVIYGVHPVEEYLAIAPQAVERLVISGGRRDVARLEQLARERGVPVEVCEDEARLDELSDGRNHQGVVLMGGAYDYAKLEEVIQGCGREALVLVLDQVQDAGNLGAILRSAAAFGVAGVVIPKDRAVGVTSAVVRASAGQALRVPVCREVNISRVLERLKEAGFWSVGTQVQERGQAPWEIELKGTRVALVLGGEHAGVRRLVAKGCDFSAHIPMSEGVESLNVASAASVLMYEVSRQWAE